MTFIIGQGVAYLLVYGLISRLLLIKAHTKKRVWISHLVTAVVLLLVVSQTMAASTAFALAIVPGLLSWGLFDLARAKRLN